MKTLNPAQAAQLLQLASSNAVEEWLKGIAGAGILNDEAYWLPIGNQKSNAGAIEVSADEINPLVERVVNGMEAVVDLGIADWLKQSPPPPIPQSPHEAIEKLFKIPNGQARALEEDQTRPLADQVQVILRGTKELPTIVVRDQGLGIHPSQFHSTIVSLGQSVKGQKPYLIGMYGQGGSSTFEKCEYTLIVSRRHPSHLQKDQADLVGWTIARRHLATRSHVYTYFIDPTTQEVPFFSGSTGEAIGLKHGTYIAHVDYRNLGGFANQAFTNNAWYSLNYRVFDPLIPWLLTEERSMPVKGSRTMRGVPYRISQLPETDGIGLPSGKTGDTAVRHHVVFDYNDPSYGKLQVEWWVLQDEQVKEGERRREHAARIEPYIDRHRRYSRRHVAITRGGQMHAALTQLVFEQEHLRQIARSVVVNVNTDGLTFEAGASFFASNRADLKTESQEVVEQALRAAIETYRDELRAIERERQEEIVQGKGASDESAIRTRLDRLISAFAKTDVGSGDSTTKATGEAPEFKGREIPTYLRFARTTELALRPGVPTRIDVLTDAADKTVVDKRTRRIFTSSNNLLTARFRGGGKGRYQVEIVWSPNAPIGSRGQLDAYMERESVWHVETKQHCRLVVVPPPPPYVGVNLPTIFRIKARGGETHVRRGGARFTIETNAQDDLFEYSELSVGPPMGIPLIGHSHPRKGEIRVNLGVPEDFAEGNAGTLSAELRLANGAILGDSVELIVEPPLREAGDIGATKKPNYKIIDVRELPSGENEESWAGMVVPIDMQWGPLDVGAYVTHIGESENERQLVFYLNADNRDLKEAEKRITERRSETSVDAVRQYHRTLLCYYLYQMALSEVGQEDGGQGAQPPNGSTADGRQEREYKSYREEMIRLNKTLLYAQREFYEALLNSEPDGEASD